MWLTRLYRRFRGLVHEFGKFGLVGGAAYVMDTAIFFALVQVMESLAAKTVATVVAATGAFVGNRFWTWRHRRRSGLTREYVLYFVFNGIGLVLALAILGVSHYGLGALWPMFQSPLADVIAANVVGLAAGTVFRFWSYRSFVFPEPLPEPDPEPESESTPPQTTDGDRTDPPADGTGPVRATRLGAPALPTPEVARGRRQSASRRVA